jgi:hypothetical protein
MWSALLAANVLLVLILAHSLRGEVALLLLGDEVE